jgi:uncharacterized membrane protein YbhN (UPF0104 family)
MGIHPILAMIGLSGAELIIILAALLIVALVGIAVVAAVCYFLFRKRNADSVTSVDQGIKAPPLPQK